MKGLVILHSTGTGIHECFNRSIIEKITPSKKDMS